MDVKKDILTVRKDILTAVFILLFILIICTAIWGFNYLYMRAPKATDLTDNMDKNAEMVCKNLDNGKGVYYTIVERKASIEASMNMAVKGLLGNETKAMMWDKDGVMCKIPIDVCQRDYLFCMRIDMIVPVSFVDWNDWYNNNATFVNNNGTVEKHLTKEV
jgi:hypothetical protein